MSVFSSLIPQGPQLSVKETLSWVDITSQEVTCVKPCPATGLVGYRDTTYSDKLLIVTLKMFSKMVGLLMN